VRLSRDHLGEGPVWDGRTNELLSVDITRGTVVRWDPSTGAESRIAVAGEVSAVVPRHTDGVILAIDRQLVLRQSDNAEKVLATVEPDLDENRFNDCRCDPQGRLWAGTMSKRRTPGTAALYRLSPEGELTTAVEHTTISNGLGWSVSGERMYFVDSTTQRVDAFDFDQAAGAISERRPIITVDPRDGLPDGLTVDAEDGIWLALFGGGVVRRYRPDGTLDAVVELPVSNPTCPAFGGPELDTLYITTAQHRLSKEQVRREPLAGALFALRPGVRGLRASSFAG
jgi:sugar lactone lactonase YvrE